MAVLVTGASGVVGLHIAREFASRGLDVVAFSTSGAPPHAGILLGDLAQRISFEQGNILDTERLVSLVKDGKIEGIVHAAALTGEAQARARTGDVFAVNVTGTLNVLETARQAGLRRVVYLGSASEYGRRADGDPITEDTLNPEGMYSETKFLGHRLVQRYRETFDLDAITVRVSSAYGPYTRFNPYRKLVGNALLAHLCRAAAYGEAVTLEGGGDYPRDWTYAADTALGIVLAYLAESPAYDSYNIASGRSYTLSESVAVLKEVAPEADVTVGSGQWADDPFQALNLRSALDIQRARRDLGYEPGYSLADGLRSYVAWWRAFRSATAQAT